MYRKYIFDYFNFLFVHEKPVLEMLHYEFSNNRVSP